MKFFVNIIIILQTSGVLLTLHSSSAEDDDDCGQDIAMECVLRLESLDYKTDLVTLRNHNLTAFVKVCTEFQEANDCLQQLHEECLLDEETLKTLESIDMIIGVFRRICEDQSGKDSGQDEAITCLQRYSSELGESCHPLFDDQVDAVTETDTDAVIDRKLCSGYRHMKICYRRVLLRRCGERQLDVINRHFFDLLSTVGDFTECEESSSNGDGHHHRSSRPAIVASDGTCGSQGHLAAVILTDFVIVIKFFYRWQ
ncbi:Uncharacterised protein g6408 [Pycnogonum litorale]